ncbi:DUF6789 family protein [Halobacterium jilantaiense]|uniref:Cytochrome C oxidase subunit I n=1 Tax=Halobacterium jilantaiense TaxID=355548 RepID=A0A1I0QL49_9EURY|nr:DUF6789 family protein [Halobacterium jilantaiense]SEW27983.1 hypothetical protein SAMN04487945_2713 [Halobacterium jilantaiense]
MSLSPVPTVEEARYASVDEPITARVVLAAFAGGLAGLVAMAPVVAGVPLVLGVFEVDPLLEVIPLVDGGPLVGVLVFALGGVFALPLFFVVTATFLPPREPRWARGVTMSTLFWVTFLYLFWPGGDTLTDAVFLVVTLVGHWLYGVVLGVMTHTLTGIPEHDV